MIWDISSNRGLVACQMYYFWFDSYLKTSMSRWREWVIVSYIFCRLEMVCWYACNIQKGSYPKVAMERALSVQNNEMSTKQAPSIYSRLKRQCLNTVWNLSRFKLLFNEKMEIELCELIHHMGKLFPLITTTQRHSTPHKGANQFSYNCNVNILFILWLKVAT